MSPNWKEKAWQIREPGSKTALLAVLADCLARRLPILKDYGLIRKGRQLIKK